MEIALFILYYTTLIFTAGIYLYIREKNIFSISDAIVLVTFIVISLGGYYNSYGETVGLNQLNIRVFLDYFIFFTVVPIGLLIGNKIKVNNRLVYLLDHEINIRKIKIVLLIILLYATVYFYFIRNDIPLISLLTGQITDIRELTLLRLSITHDYEQNYDIPFFLRYYKLFINDLMRFVLGIVFLFYLDNKTKYKYLFFITLVSAIFFHSYHFEKSGLIYILLILFFCYILYKSINIKDNFLLYFKFIVIAIGTIITMYMTFMGVESIKQAFENMINRVIIGQSGMIYLQDIVLQNKYDGILWGEGVPTFLLDSMLNRNIVNISKEVYTDVFSVYANQGGTGTTGGMPMFFLRSNFGVVFGLAILLALSILTGMIDNALRRALSNVKHKKIVVALYSVLIIYFVQAFISNFTRVYMLPFVFSPQLLIIILTIIYLIIKKR